MEMASQTPVTTVKQDRGSNTLVSAVLGRDEFGWLAPNLDVAVSFSEVDSLSVAVEVDVDANDAGNENQ